MSSKRNLEEQVLSSEEALESPPNKRQRLCDAEEDKQDPLIRQYEFGTDSDSEPDGTQSICMLQII